MKDLEELLTQTPPKPRRPLSASFSQSVADGVKQYRKQTRWQSLRSILHARLLTKAGATSLAGIVLLSGTVAAFSVWPKPDATHTTSKPLPSGNHIVGYDLSNCNYFGELNGSQPKESLAKTYYEVRKDSSLTDQQLENALRAVCEENISNNAVTAIAKQLPKNLGGILSTQAYTVNAISKDSITVTLDSHYDRSTYNLKDGMTYKRFATDLLTFDQSSKIAFGDLKAGDTVKMVVQDTSGKSSETPENYVALNNPRNITIQAIVKIPPLTSDPSVFYRAVAEDLVRLEPCDSAATGFCRVYDFSESK